MDKRKIKARQYLKNERNLLYRSKWRRVQRNSQDTMRKLERPMTPSISCKRQSSITKVVAKPEIASENNFKSKHSRKVETHETTRQRAESSQSRKTMKITLQVKGLLRCLIAVWNTCSSRGVEKVRDNSSMGFGKIKDSKRRLFWNHKKTKKKVHFGTLMDICHLKNAELEPKQR